MPDSLKRTLALAALPAAAALGFLLASHKPVEGGPFPPCLFHLATGLHCPGCGGTRAAYLALNGDLVGAFHQNAFLLALTPLAALYLFALARYGITGVWAPPRIKGKALTTVIAVAVITFAVARNLPWFAFLAPQPLP